MPETEPVNRVSIKPPQFDPHRPTAYFAILEAQFKLAGISVEETQFYHCLSSLPTEVVSSLPEETLTDPVYSKLKSVLLKSHEASLPEKFAQLVSNTTMTGRPTVYMKQIRGIARDLKIGDEIIRHRFVSALPEKIQPVVAAQKSTPLDELAVLADDLINLAGSTNISAITRQQQDHRQQQRHVSQFSPQPSHRQSSFSSQTLVPFHSSQQPKVCRSHIFFGTEARNCRPWCEWPQKQKCTITTSRRQSPVNSRRQSPVNSRRQSPERSGNF